VGQPTLRRFEGVSLPRANIGTRPWKRVLGRGHPFGELGRREGSTKNVGRSEKMGPHVPESSEGRVIGSKVRRIKKIERRTSLE
jgi:hypothetical protein